MITAGIDLAAQERNTGMVVLDWSRTTPTVTRAARPVTDEQIVVEVRSIAGSGGRVGIDCPLWWPREFRRFITAHAEGSVSERYTKDGTAELRLRSTDRAVQQLGGRPLSVSTDKLGSTALRAARILARLDREGLGVDRSGTGTVCEVYPAASRRAWGLGGGLGGLLQILPLEVAPEVRAELENEHVLDALVAALTARAVAVGATTRPAVDQLELAREEGWIHVPTREHGVSDLLTQA